MAEALLDAWASAMAVRGAALSNYTHGGGQRDIGNALAGQA